MNLFSSDEIPVELFSIDATKYRIDTSLRKTITKQEIRFGSTPTTESKPLKEGGDSTTHTCPKGHLIICTPTTESKPLREGGDSTTHTCPKGHLIIFTTIVILLPYKFTPN